MAAKKRNKKKPRTGVVYLDTAKLQMLLHQRGKTWKSAEGPSGPSASTWANLSNGKGVFPNTAKRVAEYFGCSVEELLRPQSDEDAGTFDERNPWPEHPEWCVVPGTRTMWQRTTNGLEYFCCQVRHNLLGDDEHAVLGRARFYDLTRVPTDERSKMREHLTRHAQICRVLSACPYLVKNVSVLPVAGEKFWWVVDEWFAARTLQDLISEGPLPPADAASVMRQVAFGLKALHERGIVMRELAPMRVLVAPDGAVRLTDLDLAKLLLRGKTVSADWPVDPYRAPEVENGKATPQADFYSWGVIALHAVTGDFTLACHDRRVVERLDLPMKLKNVLPKCFAGMPSKRPRSVEELAAAAEGW